MLVQEYLVQILITYGVIIMKTNIGTFDRTIRLTIGISLLAGAWYFNSWLLAAAGVFSLFEALFSWCAWYQLLGKNTCPINSKK